MLLIVLLFVLLIVLLFVLLIVLLIVLLFVVLPGPPWLPARRGCLARRTFEPAWPGRSHNPNHGRCATRCLLYALHAAQHHNQVRSARQVIATDRLQWLRVQEVVIARVVATGSAVRAASAAQSTTTVVAGGPPFRGFRSRDEAAGCSAGAGCAALR